MDLHHEFTVPVPAAEAWKILTDLERLAPCLPGAQLTEIEGDIYRGQVKLKVGPILAQFKGQASFVSRDDSNFLASLKAEGRDTGGKGNASATITAQLFAVDAASAKCTELSASAHQADCHTSCNTSASDCYTSCHISCFPTTRHANCTECASCCTDCTSRAQD